MNLDINKGVVILTLVLIMKAGVCVFAFPILYIHCPTSSNWNQSFCHDLIDWNDFFMHGTSIQT